jgi:hypothetical protein
VHGTHWIGGWVGLRAGMNDTEKCATVALFMNGWRYKRRVFFGKSSAVTCVTVKEQMDRHTRHCQRISVIEFIYEQWGEAVQE